MHLSSLQRTTITPLPQKLPIKVVFVLGELFDQQNECIQTIRSFCVEQNLLVETRKYDSDQYRHDRDQIARLPAMHLYVQNIHQITFYPNGRPIQIIQIAMEKYILDKEKELANRGRFRRILQKAVAAVKRLTHRKTRLEKQLEIDELEKRNSQRRRSMSMPSFSEWT